MCQILNLIILCAFGCEIWKVCDMLDMADDKKDKIKCYVRLAISSIVTGIALMILYTSFGIDNSNLIDYIKGM